MFGLLGPLSSFPSIPLTCWLRAGRGWISGFSALFRRQGNVPWGSCPGTALTPVEPRMSHHWDRCKGQGHKLWEMNENEAAVFVTFYKPFTFLFVWLPLRVPALFSISRKKQSLMPLYIGTCFVVICSQLARPARLLNWDIFSWKCVILTPYSSPTKKHKEER